MATQESDYDATLDVREIDGEPFGVIMSELEELGSTKMLLLINSFEPVPLYDVLSSRGFDHETTEIADDKYHVLIRNSRA